MSKAKTHRSFGTLSEKQFQAHLITYAKACGWKVYHTYDSRRCEPGFPDLVLVRERVLYRELKSEKGRLTSTQKEWGDVLTAAGADFKVWKPSMIKEIYKELNYGKNLQRG